MLTAPAKGRIAKWSAVGLVAAGVACLIGALLWVFAAPAAGDRGAAARPGSSSTPATLATQRPPAAAGPSTATKSARPTPDPRSTTPPPAKQESVSDSLAPWAAGVASTTGIPARAVQGYAYAEVVLQSEDPGCQLDWNTLAGIGMVESDHGRDGGASLAPDGTESKAVIGPTLDGTAGNRNLPAADHGSLTGDPVHDHAVGPMQLLPETWYQYGDAGANPENIDSAAIAAGRYLCADGRDLSTASGWWAAILSYNDSMPYAQLVFHYADGYAAASR